MRFVNAKILILLVVVAAAVAFGVTVVFAGDPVPGLDINIEQIPGGRVSTKNYNSSLSNTKSIGQVRMEVGDVLLRYGFGGEYINQITEALEGNGVYGAELKSFFIVVGLDEREAQGILLEFDKLGISKDSAQEVSADSPEKEFTEGATPSATAQPGAGQIEKEVSAPDATGATPSAADPIDGIDIALDEIPSRTAPKADEGTIKEILPGKGAEPASATAPQFNPSEHTLDSETEIIEIKDGDDMTIRKRPGRIKYSNITLERSVFYDASKNIIQNIRSAAPEERANLRDELQASRKTFQTEILSMNLSIRKNAKELRDNFRENVRATIGHVDHGKTARLALAHGKGLRMVNRFRSAITRFDHILGRLESRIEKIGIGIEAQARSKEGKVKDQYPPDNLVLLIEEAKNTQVLNKAKLVELEAKYESLLLGEHAKTTDKDDGAAVTVDYRVIAKELKSEIVKLHGILVDIQKAAGNYNSSLSNKDK